jgi:hypothetical protein
MPIQYPYEPSVLPIYCTTPSTSRYVINEPTVIDLFNRVIFGEILGSKGFLSLLSSILCFSARNRSCNLAISGLDSTLAAGGSICGLRLFRTARQIPARKIPTKAVKSNITLTSSIELVQNEFFYRKNQTLFRQQHFLHKSQR